MFDVSELSAFWGENVGKIYSIRIFGIHHFLQGGLK